MNQKDELLREGTMNQTFKLHIYKSGKADPETKITIPLSVLHVAEKLLPRKVKESLSKEGIDINELSGLFGKQGPKGKLIEIENPDEKLVILVE
ncbi:MAG: hypothetical protein GY749_26325 [Desulfobacteraceae bacterium]|nr:hypothetical protein [Desulfobacteraceae bacterium]